jgi:hypothetical protein
MKFLLLAGALVLAAFLFFWSPVSLFCLIVTSLLLGSWRMVTRAQRKPWYPVIAAIAVLILFAPAAFAADGQIDAGGIYGAWRPYIVEIVGTLLVAFVGWLLAILRQKWNIQIEDSRRDALQTALANAAGLVIAKLDNAVQGKTITISSPAVADAVNLVLKSAPDAIAHFGLTPEVLAQKIVAKIPVVANTTPAAPGA